MTNQPFGSKGVNKGPHIPSQQEWNSLNGAVGNVTVGNSGANTAEVDKDGTYIHDEAFFFPHVATVEYGNITAIIGPDRSEDFYPYVDTLSVTAWDTVYEFTNTHDRVYDSYGIEKRTSFTVPVSFPTPSVHAPVKPTADKKNGVIVSYSWQLIPVVIDVVFLDSDKTMLVQVRWSPGSAFDSDSQASLISKEADGANAASWAPSFGVGVDYTDTLEEQINAFLSPDPSIELAQVGGVEQNLKYLDATVPVARYDWDLEQDSIDRCVQLLFWSAVSTGGPSGLTSGNSQFEHPHQGEITSDTSVIIGRYREADGYRFKDSVTILDPSDDTSQVIEYATPETIALDGTYSYFIYYDIHKGSTVWESQLSKSDVWPPILAESSTGNIRKLIGYAEWVVTDPVEDSFYRWGQEMFDCPNEVVSSIRGEFAPYYHLDGSVTIIKGKVETFNNNTATIPQATFNLSVDTEIWVRVTSTASATTPSVVITGLISGTFPGMYVSVSDSIKQFNYKIGEILNDVYIPAHQGKLSIDNTMLMPLITDVYETLTNTPRMMQFHTSQVTAVGDVSNNLLVDAMILDVQVRGGGVQQMKEGSTVKFYGLIEEVEQSIIEGAIAAGQLTISGVALDGDIDRGLVQKLDIKADTANDIVLDGVKSLLITDNAGVADFSLVNDADEVNPGAWRFYGTDGVQARGFQTFTQVTVVTDVRLNGDGTFDKKTRTIYVANPGAESVWTSAGSLTTTTCP